MVNSDTSSNTVWVRVKINRTSDTISRTSGRLKHIVSCFKFISVWKAEGSFNKKLQIQEHGKQWDSHITWGALAKPCGVSEWEIKETPPSTSVTKLGFGMWHTCSHIDATETQLWHVTDSPQQGASQPPHSFCALTLISQHEAIRCFHQLHSSVPKSRVQCSKCLTASAHAMTCHPLWWGSESYRTILVAVQYVTWQLFS